MEKINIRRGLKQEDPFFVFLFHLIVGGLGGLIKGTMAVNQLGAYLLGSRRVIR